MEKIKFSIIIPHKNSVDLLEFCLDSIPRRDDIQIIVVDDNSDPEKVNFSQFPGLGMPRTEIIFDKSNKGAGKARNIGLMHAKGEWIVFMDADDYLVPNANEVFDSVIHSDADIVFLRPEAKMLCDRKSYSDRAVDYINLIEIYLKTKQEQEIRTTFWVPWSKFYKMDYIKLNKIKFDEIPYSNDVYFSTKAGCLAKKIEVLNCSFYVVTESDNSLTSKMRTKSGEKESRLFGYFHAMSAAGYAGYQKCENQAINILCNLYYSDFKMFIVCICAMKAEGYSSFYILNRLSKNISRIQMVRKYLSYRINSLLRFFKIPKVK